MQQTSRGLVLLLGSLIGNLPTAQANEVNAVAPSPASPALARFVQTVVDSNPRTRAARASYEASVALEAAADRPLYNPELTLQAENADTDTRSAGISQTIDWGDKRSARTRVAESQRLAAEAEYLGVRWSVSIELLSGLAAYQTALEQNQLADARVRLMNEFATLARRRLTAGDLTQVELDLALLAATGARMQKATVAAALVEARQRVRNLTPQSTPAQWPGLPNQLPGLPSATSDPERLLLALPEVQAAQRQVEATSAAVELRKRERRPDPTVSLASGREDRKFLIGLNVSIPLFVRNRFNQEVLAAVAEQGQAEQRAEDVLRHARTRLVSALERYRLSRGAWNDWRKTGDVSVNRQAGQLRRLWAAGEISTTEYLVQLRQTLDVQAGALDLRLAWWRAWFEWLRAAGRVDTWLSMGAPQ